eukprot:4512714-Pleurochrysis_carterae.AAC.2
MTTFVCVQICLRIDLCARGELISRASLCAQAVSSAYIAVHLFCIDAAIHTGLVLCPNGVCIAAQHCSLVSKGAASRQHGDATNAWPMRPAPGKSHTDRLLRRPATTGYDNFRLWLVLTPLQPAPAASDSPAASALYL